MLTGIPKLVLVAGYKEGILFSEFFIIKSILGISFYFISPEWCILFGGFTAGTLAFFIGELNDN